MRLQIAIVALICNMTAISQTKEIVRYSDSVLSSGNFKACQIFYDFPEEIKRVQEKCIKNLRADSVNSKSYRIIQLQKGSTDIKFSELLGISQSEFDTMRAGFEKGKTIVCLDTLNISIRKDGGIIRFKTGKRLSVFDYLKIDTKGKKIIYDNYVIGKEIKMSGKFYAPLLNGYESFVYEDQVIPGQRSVSKYNVGSFYIGKNKNDSRTTFGLSIRTEAFKTEEVIIMLLE